MTERNVANPLAAAPSLSALALSLVLLILPGGALAQAGTADPQSASGRDVDAAERDPSGPADQPEAQLGFSPDLVGLPGFPVQLSARDDFYPALELIETRIAELRAFAERQVKEQAADETEPASGATSPALDDPRIETLLVLRDLVHRGAGVAARMQELDAAIEEQQSLLADLARGGLEGDPPYPVALLDQLRSQRALILHSEKIAARSRDQTRRRVEAAAAGLDAAKRERRRLRDRSARPGQGEGAASDPAGEEVQREVSRLSVLVAHERYRIALAQQAVARKSAALAAARLALIDARIERIGQDVVFTREALEEQLTEVEAREQAFEAQLEKLLRAGDVAETTLYRARRRLQNAAALEQDTDVLQELVLAYEEELAAARRGVEYTSEALRLAATERSLLERRYALLGGAEEEEWSRWLTETTLLLREVAEDKDFALTGLGSLQGMQLALARRLAAPDLSEQMRAALTRRVAALERHQKLAEALINAQDQVRALAERLRRELEPRVQARSFEQRLIEIKERLEAWWKSEPLVLHDQGVYTRDLVTAVGVFVLVFAFVMLAKILLRRTLLPRLIANLDREHRAYRVLAVALLRKTSMLFVVLLAFYAAMSVSELAQGNLRSWVWSLFVVVLWLQIGVWANAGAADLIQRQRARTEQRNPSAASGYGLILFFVRVGIWLVVLVSVLAHFDYPIAGLIGALGVGGIAVAFAMQNILSDIFNSMAIILDKPVQVGDFIITGDILGVIEHIGVKTTQIRSLSGEQIILSNTDLLNSRIHNFQRMRERRVLFKLGVVYQTPPEKLERIPKSIEEIIRNQRKTRFDRAHFSEYGDFSLVFEVVYFVLDADFRTYMDIHEAVNLAIYRRFIEDGVEFAYPTQELILRRASPKTSAPVVGSA